MCVVTQREARKEYLAITSLCKILFLIYDIEEKGLA
jgi:hypothetical protein